MPSISLIEDFAIEIRRQIPYSGRTDRAIVRDLFEAHDIAHTTDNVAKIFAGYCVACRPALPAIKDGCCPASLELLRHLRAQEHVALGLLTGNVRAGAKAKLGHFGLHEHFVFGGFGDDHFDRDDVAREALNAVRQHVGAHCSCDNIWVIGDTPLDVRSPRDRRPRGSRRHRHSHRRRA